MSLDISLECDRDKCPNCGHELRGTGIELFWKNYTHNVVPMWKLAGVYDALYMSDGHLAEEFVITLRIGIKHMEDNRAEYEKLNPPNNWGSYESCLPWLREVTDAFEKYPKAIVRVSK